MKKSTTLKIYCGAAALSGLSVALSAFAQQEERGYITPQPQAPQEYRGPSDPEARRGAVRDRERAREAKDRAPDTRVGRTDPRDFTQNAEDLIGQEVENSRGEALGTVENIVIDINSGRVGFIAVGPGDPLRAVPPQAFQPEPDGNRLVLDIDADRWEEAPAIDRADLRELARDRDAREIYRFYDKDYREVAGEQGRRFFGTPAHRGHGASAVAPRGRFPGETQAPRAEAPTLPPIRADQQQEREFGSPGDRSERRRLTEWRNRGAEGEIDAGETQYGAPDRPDQWDETAEEAEKPSLRNPRMQHSYRGRRSAPHAEEETGVREFGAPARERTEWERTEVPHAERLQWASDLMGQPVADSGNQSIGQLDDFIVDLRTGRARFAIISHEQEQFAIPMREVQIDEGRQVTIRPSLARLQQAPRYDATRAARQPHRAFRYDPNQPSEFGAPARERDDERP